MSRNAWDATYNGNGRTTDDWRTPRDLFAALDDEFKFLVDAAASHENHLCPVYWTAEDDGLKQNWTMVAGPIWCNPPYGRDIGRWVKKAAQAAECGQTVVLLVFVRSDTQWWHQWAMRATEWRLIRGRLAFTRGTGEIGPAPAASVVLVFRGAHARRSSERILAGLPLVPLVRAIEADGEPVRLTFAEVVSE